jgi:hypothetical protein
MALGIALIVAYIPFFWWVYKEYRQQIKDRDRH